jgi:hypothetical protein
VVTICTTSLTFSNSAFCPHSVFMCFVWIWEQTAIISLYSVNWLVFITETVCVYCAVRTGSSKDIAFRYWQQTVLLAATQKHIRMCSPGRFISKHVAEVSVALQWTSSGCRSVFATSSDWLHNDVEILFLVCRDSASVDLSEFHFINKFSYKKMSSGENMPFARDGFHESNGVVAIDSSHICF